MYKNIQTKYKNINILINNAGIASMNYFLLTPLDTAKRVMDVNYLGTFLMCREASKLMKNSCLSRIINFSTVAVGK